MLKALDLIGAIELVYDRTNDEAAWLSEVTRFVAPAFGVGLPVSSFVFDLNDEFISLGTTTGVGADRRYGREDFQRQHEIGRQHGPVHRDYECDKYTLLSRAVGPEEARETITPAGMTGDDSLGLRANATPKSGCCRSRQIRTTPPPRGRRRWAGPSGHDWAFRLTRSQCLPVGNSTP